MRADPLDLVISKNFNYNKRFYFITGNEITYMEKIKREILDFYCKKNSYTFQAIKNISQSPKEIGLFNSNKIYICNDVSQLNNDVLENIVDFGDVYLIVIENSSKTKALKNIFLKRNDSLLIECYEINKESKIKILNYNLEKKGVSLEKEIYWSLVERLDNKYMLIEKEIEKILSLDPKNINQQTLNELTAKNTIGVEKIFFEILKENQKLVNIYNERVTNQSEVNDFYFSFRSFCFLIINSSDEDHFSKNIPVYLFREKGLFVSIYKQFSNNKKKKLLKLLYKTENIFRKNNNLSLMVGLRFLLSFKKLVIA